jgi:hypothetical protein
VIAEATTAANFVPAGPTRILYGTPQRGSNSIVTSFSFSNLNSR